MAVINFDEDDDDLVDGFSENEDGKEAEGEENQRDSMSLRNAHADLQTPQLISLVITSSNLPQSSSVNKRQKLDAAIETRLGARYPSASWDFRLRKEYTAP